jgi:hypothetical protein
MFENLVDRLWKRIIVRGERNAPKPLRVAATRLSTGKV